MEAVLIIVGGGGGCCWFDLAVVVVVVEAEARSKGMKAVIMSKTPKTLVLNICRTRVESASIAGISYTMSRPCIKTPAPPKNERGKGSPNLQIHVHGMGHLLVPALLNNISNFPPVRLAISASRLAMLSALVTSSGRTSMPLASS